MRRSLLTALVLAGMAAGITSPLVNAQARPTAVQRLQTMKEANEKLLEAQTAALQKLDEVLKDAQQLRVFARRT